MATRNDAKKPTRDEGATVGYEAQLWQMADTLRGSMDAAECKDSVLGLIFLKYIPDAFEEHLARLDKHILRKHGYPPDKQEKATQTVLEQAALLSAEWSAA